MEGAPPTTTTAPVVATSEVDLSLFPVLAQEIQSKPDVVKKASKDQKLLVYALMK